jgi:hypothetical protein
MGTTAVMVKAAWLRNWLYHGRSQLFGVALLRQMLRGHPAAVTYSHQLTGATDAQVAFAILIIFAVIALVLNGLIALCVRANTSPERDDPRRGGSGHPDPEPPSDSPRGAYPPYQQDSSTDPNALVAGPVGHARQPIRTP